LASDAGFGPIPARANIGIFRPNRRGNRSFFDGWRGGFRGALAMIFARSEEGLFEEWLFYEQDDAISAAETAVDREPTWPEACVQRPQLRG